MSNPIKFQTKVWQMGNNTAIPVTDEIVEQLNAGKRPLVRLTINDRYTYRSAVAVMDGNFLISLSKTHRKAAGVEGGDEVKITLELDTEARIVDIPKDLMDAMIKANVFTVFERMAPSTKKEYVRQIEDAKKQETRINRIERIVNKLITSR